MSTENAAAKELKAKLEKILEGYPLGGLGRRALRDDMQLCGEGLLCLDPSVGKHIQAHGITKVGGFSEIESLVNLLTHGIDAKREFSYGMLVAPEEYRRAEQMEVHKEGSFIIIADYKKPIEGKKDGEGIKAVLVNPALRELIPVLQQHFPHMTFLPYDKINDYLFSLDVIGKSTREEWNAKIHDTIRLLTEGEHKVKVLQGLLPSLPPDPVLSYNWKISSYRGDEDVEHHSVSLVGNAEPAIKLLEAKGLVRGEDFQSRDGTRVVVMGGESEKARRIVDLVVAKQGYSLQA